MSLVMFQVDLAVKKGGWTVFIFIFVVGVSFGIIYMYCYSGTMATETLLKNADNSYNILWYRQPVVCQKYLIRLRHADDSMDSELFIAILRFI